MPVTSSWQYAALWTAVSTFWQWNVNGTEPNWSELSRTGLDWTEPNWTGLNWTELNRIDPNWTELTRTEPNWTELNRIDPNWTELSVKYSRALSGGWVATRLLAREYLFIEIIRREIFKLYELELALAEVFLWSLQNCQCKISSNKHKVFTTETVSKKSNGKSSASFFVSFSHSCFRDVILVTCVRRENKTHIPFTYGNYWT
jgi:hypothetical protein